MGDSPARGDSTVNFEMRFWIDDPANGVINVRSQVLVAIWAKFRANEIRISLAHRDLFIKPKSELTVRLSPALSRTLVRGRLGRRASPCRPAGTDLIRSAGPAVPTAPKRSIRPH